MLRTSVCHPSPCKQAPVWEATSKGFVHLIFDELDDFAVQVINLKQENSVHFKNETNWMNEIRSLGWLFHNYIIHYTELMHRTYPKTGVQKAVGWLSAPHHEERATGQEG